MALVRRSVTLINPKGLHARPVGKILEIAQRYQAALFIRVGPMRANGRRLFDMLALSASAPLGTVLELEADGEDAEALVTALERLVAAQFGD